MKHFLFVGLVIVLSGFLLAFLPSRSAPAKQGAKRPVACAPIAIGASSDAIGFCRTLAPKLQRRRTASATEHEARAEKQKTPLVKKNTSFGKGEQLQYRVYFGFFKVGEAFTKIDHKVHQVNAQPCYKIDAFGETSDWISWIARVKDNWGAYIDTTNLSTQVSYRKQREGGYKIDEVVKFDHESQKAEVKVLNYETGIYENPRQFDIPKNAKDLVGGFMLLRSIDYSKVHKGDTVTISGFFEDTSYHLKVMYQGKEVIKTVIGKIRCHLLIPVMPDNKLFDGENSISVWISDDENKIPVKIQAKMFIGHTGLELEEFRGLRNQLKIVVE